MLVVVLDSLPVPVPVASAAQVICTMPTALEALRAKHAHLVDHPTIEDEPTALATPAMLATAHAGDMREAFPTFHDDEEGDRLYRTSGAGYVNATMAHEG